MYVYIYVYVYILSVMNLSGAEILLILIFTAIIALLIYVWHSGLMRGFNGGAARLKNLAKHPRTKSEQFVVSIFEKITGKSFPTVHLPWLKWKGRPMELDGYNDELKVAVEFSGPLHTRYYPDKESYESYQERVAKDREKLRLCRKNDVHLIVIDMTIPQRHMYNYIHSRLWDIGIAKERPWNYMPEIVAEPYENKQLEKNK